jgi:vacuolar-type H+-ATPase subunit H
MTRGTAWTGVKSVPGHHPEGDGTLLALLETERELTFQVQEAEAEGERLVVAAREEAQSLEREAAVEQQALLAKLDSEEQAALEAAVAETAAAAARDAVRFDAVPDERVRRLADAVLRDFLGQEHLGSKETAR